MTGNLLVLSIAFIQINPGTPAAPTTTSALLYWVQVASICGAALSLLTFAFTQALPRIQTVIARRSLQKRIGAQSYTVEAIERSFRYFVTPLCQDIDPAGGEEPRMVYGVKQKLYDALDEALANPSNKYLILLADSGMGKTTALLNYYVKYLRKWRKPRYELALVPLSDANADQQIGRIQNQANTVLLLDALDEDTLAMVDYRERLRLLLNATSEFRAVLMSCRTQFFSKDEEIPKQTGQLKVSARAAGENAEYYFQKIYLSPFSDRQVSQYLRRRYPFWRRKQRKRARQIVLKMPHLAVRPMLLAHVDDLLRSKEGFDYAFQLYDAMVSAWIERERGFIEDSDALRQFSERLAVDLYLNRLKRKSERIPKSELSGLAKKWGIALEDWKLSGRSLLNRDAEGNYKFAHRSIMEYLFVARFMAGERLCTTVEWTDQMKNFLWEMLQHKVIMHGALQLTSGGMWPTDMLRSHDTIKLLSEIVADHFVHIVSAGISFRERYHDDFTVKTIILLLSFILNPDALGARLRISYFAREYFGIDSLDSYRINFKPVLSFGLPSESRTDLTLIVQGTDDPHLPAVFYNRETNVTRILIGPSSFPIGQIAFKGFAPNEANVLHEAFMRTHWIQALKLHP
jgi:hypothetical protein